MKPTNYLPLLLALFVGFSNCKRDDDCPCIDPTNPECPNYDPCYGVEPPSAGFEIRESYNLFILGVRLGPDDNTFWDEVLFSSPYTGAEYKHTWYLGAEVIDQPSFQRGHGSIDVAQRPYQITVSHVLEYPIDSNCYPAASGRDSVARIYTIVRNTGQLATHGWYRGVFENQKDSFDFYFGWHGLNGDPYEPGQQFRNMVSKNFHNEFDSVSRIEFRMINAEIGIYNGPTNNAPRGILELDLNTGLFEMNYDFTEPGVGRKPFRVLGRKLNH
ncbi:MAG: hypothetical protein JJU02_03335 [Cryomorphaceae bacterium]|nr:hypothetical protein [Cryomorphaceae bacterium]